MAEEFLSSEPVERTVDETAANTRLDVFLARQFPAYSRMHLHKVIAAGGVTVDDEQMKSAYRLQPGQRIRIVLPDLPRAGSVGENIPLEIIYEDDVMAVINKPSGMVVHPAKGHWKGTVTAALQYHFDRLSTVGGATRPGVVHRLDRDTTGLLVVAKTDQAHYRLCEQWEARTVAKEYYAIVVGTPDRDRDLIDQPIGIHPYQRDKMAIRREHASSRPAQTMYETLERFDGYATVRAMPKTGRTHQIRVHLTHVGHSVLCDRLYGGRSQITYGEIRRQPENTDVAISRQALHAWRLELVHPESGAPLKFEAPLPADIQNVVAELRQWRALPTKKSR